MYNKDGLVVASVGLYWAITKYGRKGCSQNIMSNASCGGKLLNLQLISPVSATTVVYFLSCSRVLAMVQCHNS